MSENYALQVSVKGPHGEMVNIRANSPDELDTLITAVAGRVELIGALARDVADAGRAPTPTLPVTRSRPAAPAADAWTTPAPQPQPDAPSCRHGAMVFRDLTSKAGNHVRMWKCTSMNRDDECQPVYL